MEIPDLNRQLIRCLRTLGRTIRALSEGRASQKRVLRLVREAGGITQQALTARLGVQPGSASEVIRRLEETGLITRTPNALDRRTSDVRLTRAGEEMAERAEAEIQKRRGEMFACLSEEEKNQLLAILTKLSADWRTRYGEGKK